MGKMRWAFRDLYRPNPLILWVDFGVSIITAHVLFLASLALSSWQSDPSWVRWAVQGLCCTACIIAYHRAAVFLHELMHLPKGRFRAFRIAWNVLCGIPMFIPSFTYHKHIEHHRGQIFGTHEDSEYVPLEYRSRWWLIGFWSLSVVIPIMFLARYYLMSPIGWLIPQARRRFLLLRSTLAVDFSYERPSPSKRELRIITIQEIGCFAWCLFVTFALCTIASPWAVAFLVQIYLVAFGAAFINQFRALAVHRFVNHGDERNMSSHEQLLDTVNFPYRPWLTELWAPIGARFHATHHLFPSIPYHNLPEVHRRLTQHLPDDSIYHQVSAKSLLVALYDMLRRAGSKRGELQAEPLRELEPKSDPRSKAA
jgi:fatty acid desaturase